MHDELSIQISGMKARLDGVECSIEKLQEYREDLEMQIAALQGRRANGTTVIHALHKESEEVTEKAHRGWPDDPEERRAESIRRHKVAAAKKRAALQQAGAKKRWAKMTVRQKKELQAKMQKGRKAAAKKAVAKKPAVKKVVVQAAA